MTTVLHLIHSLTAGGAARTMIATAKYSAKYSSRTGPYKHKLAILDLKHTDPAAVEFAINEGMELAIARNPDEIRNEIAQADIFQVNWWQHPEMDLFLRSALPPCRLLGWFHVSGEKAPQVIAPTLVEQFDLVLGGSEHSWYAPAIQALSPDVRAAKTGYVIGGADFARLDGFTPRPHSTFNVGYIGTVNFVKMHPDYLSLHGELNIPNLKTIVCGGDIHPQLAAEAERRGWAEKFDFRGYVPDIGPVLETLDVYGYPLCEDTYAASELNLQEAMFAGVPPVVFPHGGIQRLVKHNETGLVARNAEEYREAITYLYQNPSERHRLGTNAKAYAEKYFGAENNARIMNEMYERVLSMPKRDHIWPGYKAPGQPENELRGAEVFLESLGGLAPEFEISRSPASLEAAFEADNTIAASSPLMRNAGILPYQSSFQTDPNLQLWGGLAMLAAGQYAGGAKLLLEALESNAIRYPERLFWYLGLASAGCEDFETEQAAFAALEGAAPGSNVIQQLLSHAPVGRKLTKMGVLRPIFE